MVCDGGLCPGRRAYVYFMERPAAAQRTGDSRDTWDHERGLLSAKLHRSQDPAGAESNPDVRGGGDEFASEPDERDPDGVPLSNRQAPPNPGHSRLRDRVPSRAGLGGSVPVPVEEG